MNNKNVTFCSNRIYESVTKYLFPILLVALSFVGVNKGIDCTDTTYNLGNYTYLSGLDPMWYYSTLISNFIGWIIVRLPGGATMLGANLYFGVIKASFGLYSYWFFTKRMFFFREVVFVANVISFGLWWIPNAGLYHYLSFYLFAIAAVLLYEGLSEDNYIKLVCAGVVLALNVFVRFPNLVQAGMIVVVWWHAILKKDTFKKVFMRTLHCIVGYVGTLSAVFGIIALCGKLGNYITAIRELFDMTGDAKKYGSKFMLVNLVNSYTCVWYWMIPIVLGIIVLLIVAFIPEKLKPFGYISSVLGFVVIYAWDYRTELFDYSFSSYGSIYRFMVVVSIIILGILGLGLFMKSLGDEVRVWCLIAIVIQLITPIGSNNSLYAVMNNMFFTLPVALYVLVMFKSIKVLKFVGSGLWTYFLIFMIQSLLFCSTFAFRDGFVGKVGYKVENSKVLSGMKTEEVNARYLEKMTSFWEENGLNEYSLITFGDIPGYSYLFGSKPAISSTWISLDSYSSDKLAKQLINLEKRMEQGESVAVAADITINNEGRKQDILKEFLQKYSFKEIYNDSGLTIWTKE